MPPDGPQTRHLYLVDPALPIDTCPVCGDPEIGLHFHISPRRAAHYTDRLPDDWEALR